MQAGLALSGCDRENGAQGQDAPSDASQSPVPTRYAIDASHRGSPLPGALVRDEESQEAALTELAGTPVILNLWATWCGPCVEELPTLNRLAARVAGQAHVIALSQDLGDDGSGPRQFLIQHGWGDLAAWHDPDNEIGLVYGGGLPTTILFGADGREVARVIGPMDWNGPAARALLAEAGITQ
ncbi:MAG: TlpA disulfide reductase family protein [Sphingopyxis sp.]